MMSASTHERARVEALMVPKTHRTLKNIDVNNTSIIVLNDDLTDVGRDTIIFSEALHKVNCFVLVGEGDEWLCVSTDVNDVKCCKHVVSSVASCANHEKTVRPNAPNVNNFNDSFVFS